MFRKHQKLINLLVCRKYYCPNLIFYREFLRCSYIFKIVWAIKVALTLTKANLKVCTTLKARFLRLRLTLTDNWQGQALLLQHKQSFTLRLQHRQTKGLQLQLADKYAPSIMQGNSAIILLLDKSRGLLITNNFFQVQPMLSRHFCYVYVRENLQKICTPMLFFSSDGIRFL